MSHLPNSMVDDQQLPLRTVLARQLLQIGAVILKPDEPFTWASGLRSPIYCDNRLTMAYPKVRRLITRGFVNKMEESILSPDVIVGTATAGIPHAAWLAEQTALPMAYVRSKPKEHGRGNQVEGIIRPDQNVLVIEDLISTGMSSLAVVQAIRETGATVLACLSIFSYDLDESLDAFHRAGVEMGSLTHFSDVLEAAENSGEFKPTAIAALKKWRIDPVSWSHNVSAA